MTGILTAPPQRRIFGNVILCDYPNPTNVRRIDGMALPMLAQMMRNGIRVDPAHFRSLDKQLEVRQLELEESIEVLVGGDWRAFGKTKSGAKWAGKKFMPSSTDQVAALVFDWLDLRPEGKPSKTKTGRLSTEDEVLSAIKHLHPFVELELDHREVSKLRSTYTGPLPTMVDTDGRLRTVFKPNRTATGRLSSGDRKQGKPNLQNIPIRSSLLVTVDGKQVPVGVAIRNGFIAGPGNVLVSGDLSQIEMRFAAHLAGGCEAMRLIFVLEEDIHTKTAIALFKLVPEEVYNLLELEKQCKVTKVEMPAAAAAALKEFKRKYRLPAKNLGFGILYGQTALGLQAKIMAEGGPFIPEAECQSYIDGWFAIYWEIRQWLELQWRRVRQFLGVWTCFGRWRPIVGIRSVLQDKVNEAEREAGNTPIQGSAGDLLKIIMGEMTQWVEYFAGFQHLVCLPLLQVHDELVFELSQEAGQDFAQILRRVMRTAVELLVPVDSSADVALAWGELK